MRVGFSPLLAVALLVVLGSCATGKGSGFAREAVKERAAQEASGNSEEKKQDKDREAPPKTPQITIVTDPSQARISVNGRTIGTGVVTIDSVGFGQRIEITAEAPSYHPKTVSVALWGQTDTIALDLDPILGTLELRGAGLDEARFLLPGWAIGPGRTPVIIGDHELLVRRFGYADQRLRFTIREDQTTTLDLAFDPVPFQLSGLVSDHPDGFNPESAAIAARVRFSFQASGPGHALAVLRNPGGLEVARWGFADLRTWDQEARWEGRLDGETVPDGVYVLTLTGGPEPGTDTVQRTLSLEVSRSLIDKDRASLGPAAGFLWTPVPEVLSPGTLQLSTLALGHVEGGLLHAPVSTSFRISPSRGWELFGQASFRLWSESDLNSFYGTFAVKQRIPFGDAPFRLAWVAGATLGTWLTGDVGIPPTDYLTTFPAVRVLLPASWTWGKWSLVVAPELDGSFWSPSTAYETATPASEGPRLWAYGRFGLAYDPGPYSVALSGVARTHSFDVGTSWLAPAHLGLEGRFPVPETPLTLTGYLSVSAYSTVDYAWYGGVGLSLLVPASLTLDLASQLKTSP